jgi:hypothetical protein
MYRSAFDAEQKVMAAEIEKFRRLVKHAAEKGGLIEGVFREALRRIVPEKIGVTSGFVVDAKDNISRQLDVILYDRLNTPRILYDGELSILPVECTYAAGEIKTSLQSAELSDCFEKCASYKSLERSSYFEQKHASRFKLTQTYNLYGQEDLHWPSMFFVLSVDGMNSDTLAAKAVEEACNRGLDGRSKIDTIACMNGPVLINGVSKNGTPQAGLSFSMQPGQSWCGYVAQSPWALFAYLLVPLLTQAPSEEINLISYPSGGAF